MERKLYIGNLSYGVDAHQLTDLFSQVGGVDTAKIITDRDSGRSKGFGFVEMNDANEAQKVVEKFNGYELEGRAMNVMIAKPQEPRNSGGRSSGGYNRY